MEYPSESEQASLKWKQNYNSKQDSNHNDIKELKKSTDSLYKQLQLTPNDQKSSKNDFPPQNSTQMSFLMLKEQSNYKVNLFSKFENQKNHAKQQKIFDKEIIRHPQNLKKPSTPTFNTKSSLNFLKHRKQQIIMNQSLGLALNNLQILRKSRSESRQNSQKSQSPSHKISNLPNFKNTGIKNHLKNLSNLIGNSQKSIEKMKKNTRSFSNLQNVEAILNGSFERKNSKFQIEQLNRKKYLSILNFRTRSMNNQLRSSRSPSIQSFNEQNIQNLSRSRSSLLNSINQKLTEAKLLKNLAIMKQKREKKVNKEKQMNLIKRLNNLEMILSQLESRSINNRYQERRGNFQVIGTLKNQISQLNKQIHTFSNDDFLQVKKVQNQKQTINKANYNLGQSNHIARIRSNSNIQPKNVFFKAFSHQQSQKSQFINNVPSVSSNQLSKGKVQQNKISIPQTPVKVTFNYINTNNPMVRPKNLPNHPIPYRDNNNFRQQIRYQNPPTSCFLHNNYNTPIMPNNSYPHTHRDYSSSSRPHQVPINFQVNNLNHYPHQQIQMNNTSQGHKFQIGMISNKSLSLKNKHALEVKNYSPIKNVILNNKFSKQNSYQVPYPPY